MQFFSSTITTVGLYCLALSSEKRAYAIIITISPGCANRAAAPFKQITPEFRGPGIV